jgi:hypothetical protein
MERVDQWYSNYDTRAVDGLPRYVIGYLTLYRAVFANVLCVYIYI